MILETERLISVTFCLLLRCSVSLFFPSRSKDTHIEKQIRPNVQCVTHSKFGREKKPNKTKESPKCKKVRLSVSPSNTRSLKLT